MLKGYMILSILLFSIGIVGLISRRNIIVMYMSIELLLNAVNLSLIAISGDLADSSAQVMSLIIIAIAASEAALFMSLFVVLFRNRASLDVNLFTILGGKE
ncbi:MAG: NADH-quinone oxidoreductase subunit [Campylobacterota bacterium]|jgi:NADH-quinone oxidoreductase subunit K|nr:NADH-quinone oxidoreductase subunit [Campylobacterota bacterium]